MGRRESECETGVIVRTGPPIVQVMTRLAQEHERGNAIEVHGFSCETRSVMLPRLYKVLAASGCWMVGCRRCRRSLEYSFEIELKAALDLYCGLVQAGLQMTEVSHRALTEICVLRTHDRMVSAKSRVVSVRLVMSFVEAREAPDVAETMEAWARGC